MFGLEGKNILAIGSSKIPKLDLFSVPETFNYH
jgi:hypothetical protein